MDNRKKTILSILTPIILFALTLTGVLYLLRTDPGGRKKAEKDSITPESAVEAGETELSLWVVEDNPFASTIKQQASVYGNKEKENGNFIHVQMFENEEAMAAAMDHEQPDMFISSYGRMRILCQADKLKAISPEVIKPLYKTVLAELDANIGTYFFPLGMETNILLCEKGLYAEAPKTLSSLFQDASEYGAENLKTYIYVQDFASVFNRAVKERGGEFTSNFKDNTPEYKVVYNYIGGAAYSYGVECGTYDAAALIREGYVKCAITPCSMLRDIISTEFDAYNVPQAGETQYVSGELTCIAMTPTANCSKASAFISWLSEPTRLQTTAINSFCVPVITSNFSSGTIIQQMLISIADTSLYYIVPERSEYYQHREEFNEAMISAINIMRS